MLVPRLVVPPPFADDLPPLVVIKYQMMYPKATARMVPRMVMFMGVLLVSKKARFVDTTG